MARGGAVRTGPRPRASNALHAAIARPMATNAEANNVARNLMDDSVARAERAAVYRRVPLFGRGELAAPLGFGVRFGVGFGVAFGAVAGAAAATTLPAGTTTV